MDKINETESWFFENLKFSQTDEGKERKRAGQKSIKSDMKNGQVQLTQQKY